MISVIPRTPSHTLSPPETEVAVLDDYDAADDGSQNGIIIHPMGDRYGRGDEGVYLSVGWFHKEDHVVVDGEQDVMAWNVILPRDEVVKGLLTAFPELALREDRTERG